MTKRKQQPPQSESPEHHRLEASKLTYSIAQIAFVIQTPSSNSKNNAKLVRSHAARIPSSQKQGKQLKSWILKKEDKSSLQIPDGSIPGRVGSKLSLLDFPEPLKPYMENDMFRCKLLITNPPKTVLQTIRASRYERDSLPPRHLSSNQRATLVVDDKSPHRQNLLPRSSLFYRNIFQPPRYTFTLSLCKNIATFTGKIG